MNERTIAILGPGLLGGSLLQDGLRLGWRMQAWARREETAAAIRIHGLAAVATTDLAQAVQGASLIILTTPTGTYESLARRLAACQLELDAVVTDVGSVKQAVLDGAGCILRKAGIPFVGSHPMAGSHEVGLDAARTGLFASAACLLTPEPDTSPGALQRVRNFWETLGCRVVEMNAAAHDAAVAHVSHMPHLAAAAVTLAALAEQPELGALAAGGLRDTTRVASGDPAMWKEILMTNRTAVLDAARKLQRNLGELLEMLEKVEDQALFTRLTAAKALRDARYPRRIDGPQPPPEPTSNHP
ncbi:MAG: prephenate dehydrogenase/arogenate dehydrogenase family protein [Verrucomicrobiales bacterium]|nr:prephenate dehydrogenase/arogenate dehydrogenase family protein [Verrucomicrobiales bacterium]